MTDPVLVSPHVEDYGDRRVPEALGSISRFHPGSWLMPAKGLTAMSALVLIGTTVGLQFTAPLRELFLLASPDGSPRTYPVSAAAVALLVTLAIGQRASRRPGPDGPRYWILVLALLSAGALGLGLFLPQQPTVHAFASGVLLASLVLLSRLVSLRPTNSSLRWMAPLLLFLALTVSSGAAWSFQHLALSIVRTNYNTALQKLVDANAAAEAIGEASWGSYNALRNTGGEAIEADLQTLTARINALDTLYGEHTTFQAGLGELLRHGALLDDVDPSAGHVSQVEDAYSALTTTLQSRIDITAPDAPRLGTFYDYPPQFFSNDRWAVNESHPQISRLLLQQYRVSIAALEAIDPAGLSPTLQSVFDGAIATRDNSAMIAAARMPERWMANALVPGAITHNTEDVLQLSFQGGQSLTPASVFDLLKTPLTTAKTLVGPDSGCKDRAYPASGYLMIERIDCYSYAEVDGAALVEAELRVVYTGRRSVDPFAQPDELYYLFMLPPDYEGSLSAYREGLAIELKEQIQESYPGTELESLSGSGRLLPSFRLTSTEQRKTVTVCALENAPSYAPTVPSPTGGSRRGVVLRVVSGAASCNN